MPNTAFFGASAGTAIWTVVHGEHDQPAPVNVPANDGYFITKSEWDQVSAQYGAATTLNNRLARLRMKQLIGWNGRGGSDESYDVPDFQNMALAMIPSGRAATPGDRLGRRDSRHAARKSRHDGAPVVPSART